MMTDWNPALYLKFGNERTQPAYDLANRIPTENPERILDIGCGPGNSTDILAGRWPKAEVTGIDSSASMIEKARNDHPALRWIEKDAGKDLSDLGTFDIVFSNAALQWIPDHDRLIPHIFSLLKKDGILAVQVPNNGNSPMQTAARTTASSTKWKKYFATDSFQIYDSPETYYSQISPLTAHVQFWQTIYYQIMASHESILEWSRATFMRPYLDSLPGDAERKTFEDDILQIITPAYPLQKNGKILFPFKRLFFIAHNR